MFLRFPVRIIEPPGATRRLKGTDISVVTLVAEVHSGNASATRAPLPNPAKVFFFGAEAYRLQKALERLPDGGAGALLLVGGAHRRAMPAVATPGGHTPAVEIVAAWFVVREEVEGATAPEIEQEELELLD